jgi:hypothetical protein
VAKIEERMKTRMEQLSVLPQAPLATLASSPARAGWSSTF